MTDIVDRLRDRAYSTKAGDPLCEEAANEIERLKNIIAEYTDGISPDDKLKPTLTDEEREAIGVAIQCVVAAKAQRHPEEEESRDLLHKTDATLRKLLERLG